MNLLALETLPPCQRVGIGKEEKQPGFIFKRVLIILSGGPYRPEGEPPPPPGGPLREWILEVREVKSEMEIWFTHFEK